MNKHFQHLFAEFQGLFPEQILKHSQITYIIHYNSIMITLLSLLSKWVHKIRFICAYIYTAGTSVPAETA